MNETIQMTLGLLSVVGWVALCLFTLGVVGLLNHFIGELLD